MNGKKPVGIQRIPSNFDDQLYALCQGAVIVLTELSQQYLGSGSDKDF